MTAMAGSPLPGPYLVFQLKHIGDLLQTLPALDFIRRTTGRPVDLAVGPGVAELARRHPWAGDVLVLDKRQRMASYWRTLRGLGRRRYGAAFIFDGQARSLAAAVLAGVNHRVGAEGLYRLGKLAPFYNRTVDIADKNWFKDSQAVRTVKTAAAALGLKPGPARRPPPLRLDQNHRERARGLLARLDGDGPPVGLTLRGLQLEKSWPLASFAKLCRQLWGECRARLFVTGGVGESAAAQALAQAAGVPVADFCGQTSLPELAALAEQSGLFITIDTGTAHIVALTETPLISIYLWTSPALWPPQTPHARLLVYEWALQRFGLTPADGPWRSAPVITPEMVFQETVDILERT